MEGTLDAIARGEENWEQYIINWNKNYFVPALEKAVKVFQSIPHASKVGSRSQGQESKIICPQCQQKMLKIPSQSKKLHRNYFLKCPSCETVMFYNKWKKEWEKPGEKREMLSQPGVIKSDIRVLSSVGHKFRPIIIPLLVFPKDS